MLGKGKSVGEDLSAARVPPLQRSGIAQPAATLHPSEAISSIGAEMTVVGKIICTGIIKIYGFVEGELSASNAMIADSARIDGDIVAEELTIGGRVKGNIYALRVKLRGTAVVEGDIYHRSLSIHENAWFEGWSRPEDNLPEPLSTIEFSSDLPPERQTLFAFDQKGEFKGESSGEQPRGRGTRVFLASCITAIAISVVGYFAIRAIDPSWIWRSAESHYTTLRPTTREAPHEAPVAQMAPEIVAPKAHATPSLDPEQVQDFRIDDVSSARHADVMLLTSNAIEFSDHTTAGGIDSETALMPFAAWASSHPTEKKFLALFPGYVEPVIGSDALISAAGATAFKDKAGTGNDNPDQKWCTGAATLICIQSTYKFEGKIPMGIMLVNQLRDSKKVVDHIDFRRELAALAPSDLDRAKENQPQETPKGPLQIIISIADQRVSLYHNGTLVARSSVSTGVRRHPTPLGVFSVVEKQRWHRSNIYSGAPMPYMQRVTWSGIALHAGELPGYPASHGCIRLTNDFAIRLWHLTKRGTRVIIARQDVVPVEITNPHLFVSKPKTASGSPESLAIAVAGNRNKTAATTQAPLMSSVDTQETADSQAVGSAPSGAAPQKVVPISVFVSRKLSRLFVRQGFTPLFDVPVKIQNSEEPLGTHVFTVMEPLDKGSAVRWSVVSIPEQSTSADSTKERKVPKQQFVETAPSATPLSDNANTALDRIEIPQDAVEQISQLLIPGSSLIISDYGISSETGPDTDFIVLTH